MPALLRPHAVAAAVVAILLACVLARPAGAATQPPSSVPVVFVHGFYADHCPSPGLNVTTAMSGPVKQLTSAAWQGRRDVVSYYACDVGGTRIGSDTTNTPIETIAAQLATYVYTTYTAHGQTVDVVAHSMGGLVIRAALLLTQQHAAGFPASLLVRRVVTFSTPHNGIAASTTSSVPGLTGTYQGKEVVTGSTFLQKLAAGGVPQGSGGTTWLVVGSSGGCDLVPGASATALAGVRMNYTGCWSHVQYLLNPGSTAKYAAWVNSSYLSTGNPLYAMYVFLSAA